MQGLFKGFGLKGFKKEGSPFRSPPPPPQEGLRIISGFWCGVDSNFDVVLLDPKSSVIGIVSVEVANFKSNSHWRKRAFSVVSRKLVLDFGCSCAG